MCVCACVHARRLDFDDYRSRGTIRPVDRPRRRLAPCERFATCRRCQVNRLAWSRHVCSCLLATRLECDRVSRWTFASQKHQPSVSSNRSVLRSVWQTELPTASRRVWSPLAVYWCVRDKFCQNQLHLNGVVSENLTNTDDLAFIPIINY
jgi:hypothetical protein